MLVVGSLVVLSHIRLMLYICLWLRLPLQPMYHHQLIKAAEEITPLVAHAPVATAGILVSKLWEAVVNGVSSHGCRDGARGARPGTKPRNRNNVAPERNQTALRGSGGRGGAAPGCRGPSGATGCTSCRNGATGGTWST
jgi:hypothetical protein